MAEETINIEAMRSRGLTCAKLKSMENKERRNKKNAFKDASGFRSAGFEKSAQMQEKIGETQEQLANNLANLRKKVCGLR